MTLKFIEGRLRLITSELVDVEKDVESYKTAKGFTDLTAESTLFLDKVKENDTKLNETEVQLKVLENLEQYVNKSGNTISPAAMLISDPVLVGLVVKFNELILQKRSSHVRYNRIIQCILHY
jgi:hypothetical protein